MCSNMAANGVKHDALHTEEFFTGWCVEAVQFVDIIDKLVTSVSSQSLSSILFVSWNQEL